MTTAHDLSTPEGLAEYRSTFLPPIYRDELTPEMPPRRGAKAMSVDLHYDIAPARHVEAGEATTVLWVVDYCATRTEVRATLFGDGPRRLATYRDGDPIPVWVPRPPASWLTLAAELWGAVS